MRTPALASPLHHCHPGSLTSYYLPWNFGKGKQNSLGLGHHDSTAQTPLELKRVTPEEPEHSPSNGPGHLVFVNVRSKATKSGDMMQWSTLGTSKAWYQCIKFNLHVGTFEVNGWRLRNLVSIADRFAASPDLQEGALAPTSSWCAKAIILSASAQRR
eukprot:4620457-Amphidinium_carterae.1